MQDKKYSLENMYVVVEDDASWGDRYFVPWSIVYSTDKKLLDRQYFYYPILEPALIIYENYDILHCYRLALDRVNEIIHKLENVRYVDIVFTSACGFLKMYLPDVEKKIRYYDNLFHYSTDSIDDFSEKNIYIDIGIPFMGATIFRIKFRKPVIDEIKVIFEYDECFRVFPDDIVFFYDLDEAQMKKGYTDEDRTHIVYAEDY